VDRLGGAGEVAQLLGHQQIDIDLDPPGEDGPAQQRPRLDAAELCEPAVERSRHPGVKVGMDGEELTRDPQTVTFGPIRDPDRGEVLDVAGQQRMIGVGGVPGHGEAHPITARAAAYSAARCSTDRCT
jgi:hypothetical protein